MYSWKKAYYIYSCLGRKIEILVERGLNIDILRAQIAKEEFDAKARLLLGDSNIQLHNEFLFAILVKCQLGIHSGNPRTRIYHLNPNHVSSR